MYYFFAEGKPVTATSQQGGRRTGRIEKTNVLGKEVKADPNWGNLVPVGLEDVGERRSLRKRKQICYAEADLPDLDNYLYCDFCDVCYMIFTFTWVIRTA
jgi:hypothetical protein